jgi:SAM-dependent methyltransferase
VSPGYSAEVAPQFETFAKRALELVVAGDSGNRPLHELRIVDVATGPGTLARLAARAGASVEALDFSPDMVNQLHERSAPEEKAKLRVVVGDGMQLPYPDAAFDAGFSMFGLMFFPDRQRGFQELARVLRPGSLAVVASWQDLAADPLLGAMFRRLGELLGHGQPPPAARPMFPLVAEADCVAEMTRGGFAEVRVVSHSLELRSPSPADFLAHVVRTNVIVALAKQARGAAFEAIEKQLVDQLAAANGPGEVRAMMVANLIVGRVPAPRPALRREHEPRDELSNVSLEVPRVAVGPHRLTQRQGRHLDAHRDDS